MKEPLGRLERVELRKYWLREDTEFTPWLAEEANLELLSEALGLDLGLEDTEVGVGPYRADILAKDTATGHFVLIENQIERTDHSHLGQLLTYAAGLEAVTVVWVASSFTDEHRAALDWLNRVTTEAVSFFGVEVELWRIGESPPAPNFKVVSKPNDWARSVAEAAQHGELTPAQARNRDFWTSFRVQLEAAKSPLALRQPSKDNWQTWGVGRSGFHIWARLAAPAYVGLAVTGDGAAERYAYLRQHQDAIAKEFGDGLEWQTEAKKEWMLKIPCACNPDDRTSWPQLQEWMRVRLERLDKVFRPRVKQVPGFAPSAGAEPA